METMRMARVPPVLVGPLLALLLAATSTATTAAQQAVPTEGLLPYATPNGGTIWLDARLVPALEVLGTLEVGRDLLETLARAGITVRLEAEPPGIWAHYDPAARAIVVDRSFAGVDPRTVATILSHEATHARNDAGGAVGLQARAAEASSACYADEHDAAITELHVWQALFGPGGKAHPQHRYERELNGALARYRNAPDHYRAELMADYARVCGS
jgi:hypothetical protein